ncbi:hypothetical protein ABI125_13430 [Tamlana crocina]|uniref:Uncharacterized protein n=1 Tax=Tamlana crocina TaxID=393006 RepID=A0ABX1DIE3_9FLAO|nr:hypothetical protein [Tamlana crocina]NJX16438.1 hypothetical protein [Tamlana crocina]
MPKSLFLLCPTDCLEPIINSRFHKENYFYTSLGNSFIYNRKTIKHIHKLIKKHQIEEIYFVLSSDNQIILDALGNQDFSNFKALNRFYNDINKHTAHLDTIWHSSSLKFSIISYYLNRKIKLLQSEIDKNFDYQIKIRGKIYDKQDHVFTAIYSDLISIEKHHLN